jgi:serine/threonine protein kinase
MQTKEKIQASFFDDENESIGFDFIIPDQKHKKDLGTPAIYRSFLTCTDFSTSLSHEGFYALHNRFIVNYGESSESPQTVLDLAQSRLNTLPATETNSSHGFMVTKNGNSYEFYSTDKQTVDDWIKVLRSICVVTDFHKEYKAIKMIGQGGFAKVYLVKSSSNNERYAVKAFTKDNLIAKNKSNAKAVLLNEINILKALNHDNIIKLYEVHESENSIYLVMELIQGNSLQDILQRNSLRKEYSDAQFIKMARDILDSLAYIASKGIMHRDLKPSNILVEKGGKIKIVDFGLATYIDLPEYIFRKCGTPGYIAPEVFKYNPKIPATSYDDKCDVFSVGCILYFILFKHPLFSGYDDSDALEFNKTFAENLEELRFIRKEIKNSGSQINKEGLNLLLELLEIDKQKRISAIQALNHPYLISESSKMIKISSAEDIRNLPLLKLNWAEDSSPSGKGNTHSFNSESTPLSTAGCRFIEKDSLYLDVGKTELNGKVDSITGGSANNSITIKGNYPGSPASPHPQPSIFGKAAILLEQRAKGEVVSSRGSVSPSNQSFLKAAIFRNMLQKSNENSNREENEDEIPSLPERRENIEEFHIQAINLNRIRDDSFNPSEDAYKTLMVGNE